MLKFNIHNPSDSDIQFKISRFPDGQQDIVIQGRYKIQDVIIKSHFNSFLDLELIICTNKALRRLGFKNISLFIPYLLGARSDRQFQEGGTSYLVDIIAPIINAQNFESVIIIDPHSDVAPACINNLIVENNNSLVDWAINTIKRDNLLIVSPDAGALKKIYSVAKHISYKKEIIIASKVREIETGKILSTEVLIPTIENADFVIVDDICDGGRTFIELAKTIKLKSPNSKIYLVVTHGIFSSGLRELSQYFQGIYTTNSVMDISCDTEFGMRNEVFLNKVHQLNIF